MLISGGNLGSHCGASEHPGRGTLGSLQGRVSLPPMQIHVDKRYPFTPSIITNVFIFKFLNSLDICIISAVYIFHGLPVPSV